MRDLVQKLQANNQHQLLIINLPNQLQTLLELLPGNITTDINSDHDACLIFVETVADSLDIIQSVAANLHKQELVWFCYPKVSSENFATDMDKETCTELFEPYGLSAVRQVSLDADWMGIRFQPKSDI